MRLNGLWEVYGPSGRFDEDGNFVPTEKFGIIPSLFMNLVILPIVAGNFALQLSVEFLKANIASLLERRLRRSVNH